MRTGTQRSGDIHTPLRHGFACSYLPGGVRADRVPMKNPVAGNRTMKYFNLILTDPFQS